VLACAFPIAQATTLVLNDSPFHIGDNPEYDDIFPGPYLGQEWWEVDFPMASVPTSGSLTVQVMETGLANPVYVNGNLIGPLPNTGRSWVTGELPVPGAAFTSGVNTLRIECASTAGGNADDLGVWNVSLTYEGPRLPDTPAVNPGQLEIFDGTGFRSDPVAFDTDPDNEQCVFDPAKPTVVLVHGWNGPSVGDWDLVVIDSGDLDDVPWLHGATHTRDGDSIGKLGVRQDINVLAWNWLEGAKSRDVEITVDGEVMSIKDMPDEVVRAEGHLLAEALDGLIRSEGSSAMPIHFIGHSLGGGVATHASEQMHWAGYDVAHLTVFDAPEMRSEFDLQVAEVIRGRPLALMSAIERLTAAGVAVDSYPSAFGMPYAGAANVDMLSTFDREETEILRALDHGYPMPWYFGWDYYLYGTPGTLVGTLRDETGFPSPPPATEPLPEMGAAWSSVLSGMSVAFQPGTWQMKSTDEPYVLLGTSREQAPLLSAVELALDDSRSVGCVTDEIHFGLPWNVMETASPVYLFGDVAFAEDDVAISFDFFLEDPEDSDVFALYFRDETGYDDLLFVFYGAAWPGGTDYMNTGLIDIGWYAGRTGKLIFLYDSALPGQRAGFGNLQAHGIIPEPATLALFALGTLHLLCHRRRKS
jgi:pimeloyl-ACP methyl ester carboxylesterase